MRAILPSSLSRTTGEVEASVIVPARNAAALLPICLEALARQSPDAPHFEVIVVDDGSTDETAAMSAQWGARTIRLPEPRGPAAARNAGLQAARGSIVLFTDADCAPAPDWMAEMLRPFARAEVDGVKGAYRTRQKEVIARLAQCEFEERYDLLERSPVVDFVDTHSAAFRASVVAQAGGFDPAFPYPNNEDVDLSYRLAEAGRRLVFNRRAVVVHRHADRWRDYLQLKVSRGYWRMVVYRLHPGKALRDSYTPQLLKAQVALAGLCAGAALLSPIWPRMGWAAAASLAALWITAIPFARLVARTDAALLLWVPVFVAARAGAFLLGVAGGLIGMFTFRPARPEGTSFTPEDSPRHSEGGGAARGRQPSGAEQVEARSKGTAYE